MRRTIYEGPAPSGYSRDLFAFLNRYAVSLWGQCSGASRWQEWYSGGAIVKVHTASSRDAEQVRVVVRAERKYLSSLRRLESLLQAPDREAAYEHAHAEDVLPLWQML